MTKDYLLKLSPTDYVTNVLSMEEEEERGKLLTKERQAKEELCEVCKGEGYIPNKYKPEFNDPCIACRATGKINHEETEKLSLVDKPLEEIWV